MNSEEKIYMDQESYNRFIAQIEDIKLKLKKVNAGRKSAFDAGAGDGWDSPEFEEIERAENMLLGELKRNNEMLPRIVIIEKHNNEDVIDIGDTLQVNMEYAPNDSEPLTFRLVGMIGNVKDEIEEVSINSPLGKAVYKKKVGDNCSYEVNGMTINVNILEKLTDDLVR